MKFQFLQVEIHNLAFLNVHTDNIFFSHIAQLIKTEVLNMHEK